MLKRIFNVYRSDWRIPTSLYLGLFLLWFGEDSLAFGPGWGILWLLMWLIHWFVFLVVTLCKKDDRKPFFVGGFLLCNVLQFGGCSFYNYIIPAVPEEKECVFKKYNRFVLGQYSDCIPVGAWNIKFKYYDGLFSGRFVECQVGEKDFLWFCRRNGYKIRKGAKQVNERTGEVMSTSWFGYEHKEGEEAFYSYFDIAESGAGVKLLYDIKKETLNISWSTN